MATPEHHFDAVIFGGGIAGLWTLARLTRDGYHCLLLERRAIGSGQTIASQGIIHGGIKYTLGLAEPGDASRAIAEMPAIWQACLEGRGEVDLRAARVLSPCQFLWTTPGLRSRVAGFGASRVIRTAVEKLADHDRPAAFAHAPRSVDIYRVGEPVLDVASVVTALASPLRNRIRLWRGDDLPSGVEAAAVILAAGEGNGPLLLRHAPAVGQAAMQLRPLHMVAVRGLATPMFGHCLAGPMSSTPRITVNSVPDAIGDRPAWTWYIGGELAESGVPRDEAEQIAHARHELRACLPWIDVAAAPFSTLRINRAEARTPRGVRPDGPVVEADGRVIYGWPTKLAFAPRFADMVAARLRTIASPSGPRAVDLELDSPPVAAVPWGAEGAP